MNIFYVVQNKMFKEEFSGGFIWSPQKDKAEYAKSTKKKDGKRYKAMTMVRKGDLLFHHFDGHVVAISIAASDFYESGNPYNSNINTSWHLNEGYKVDVDYYEVNPIAINAHAQWIIDNHIESGTFTRVGKAPQGKYISEFASTYAIYFLKALRMEQDDINIISIIDNALTQLDDEIESPYNEIEKDEINELIDSNQSPETPVWGSRKVEQETTILSGTKKEVPVRNTRTAVDALIKANYLCEYNPNDRTFQRKNGKPYTE